MSWFDETAESRRVLTEQQLIVDATEEIAGALADRGWTRAQLASALRVRPSEITQRLRGRRNLTLRSVAAMFDAMGFDVEIRRVERGAAGPIPVGRSLDASPGGEPSVDAAGL